MDLAATLLSRTPGRSPSTIARALALLLGGAACLLTPSSVAAEGTGAADIDAGLRLAQEARFDEALVAFDRAAASSDLRRADLVRLLEGRAMVHHGQRDDEAFARTAAALASIAPDYTPSRRIPPRLAHRLRAAVSEGTPIRLSVQAERREGAVIITSAVENDPGGLTARVVVAVKVGTGAYVDIEGESVRVSAATTTSVSYHVRAIGPGGVLLTSHASSDEPIVLPATEAPSPDAVARNTESPDEGALSGSEDDGDDAGLPLWPFIVGGAILAVAAIVLTIALIVHEEGGPPI